MVVGIAVYIEKLGRPEGFADRPDRLLVDPFGDVWHGHQHDVTPGQKKLLKIDNFADFV